MRLGPVCAFPRVHNERDVQMNNRVGGGLHHATRCGDQAVSAVRIDLEQTRHPRVGKCERERLKLERGNGIERELME